MDESRAKALESGATMKTGGSTFNYVDLAVLERLGIGFYGTKKPNGNNFMRIVAANRTTPIVREVWKHSSIGKGKDTFLCLDKMFGKACPICDYAQKLRDEKADIKIIKELDVVHRFLLFVVDTTDRETEKEGPKWFDCPPSVWKEICLQSKDRRTGEQIDPADPEDGRDIEFVRTDGKRTSYGGFKLVKVADSIPKSWYEDLPALDDVLLIPDPEKMQTAVSGVQATPVEDKPREDRARGEDSRRESRRSEATNSDSRDRGEARRGSQEQDTDQAKSVKEKLAELRESRKTEE